MDIKSMKNIIVLKDLPSNVVEEAFVILKDNVKIHNKEIKNIKDKEKGSKNIDGRNILLVLIHVYYILFYIYLYFFLLIVYLIFSFFYFYYFYI